MITTKTFDALTVEIHSDATAISFAAFNRARQQITDAIEQRGYARVILATGNSQLEFLRLLREAAGIVWAKVDVFHLDEYTGLEADHPSSFRHYLKENFVDHVNPRNFFGIDGTAEPAAEAQRYGDLLNAEPIDLSCLGVGNNGHLAFNDPPYANFDDPHAVKLVKLDEVSRQQQVDGGLFPDLDSVPMHALTVTIPALLNASHVQVLASGRHKAQAIRTALQGPITEDCPASVLRTAPQAVLYLDEESASLLN